MNDPEWLVLVKLDDEAQVDPETGATAIKKVSVGHSLDGPRMEIAGENLALSSDARFPIAFVDGEEVPVIASGADRVVLAAPGPPRHSDRASALALALDPFTVISLELRS